MPNTESFERMRQVSTHPSYAKLVKSLRSLRYEPEGLTEYRDDLDWTDLHPSARRYVQETKQWTAWPAESHEYESEQKIVTSNAGYLAEVQKYKEQVAAAIQSDE